MNESTWDKDRYLDLLERESEALIAAIAGTPVDAPVPSCGDWTVRDLAGHIGFVWSVAGTNVAAATSEGTRPASDAKLESDADAARVADYLADRRRFVLNALRAADPAAPSWTFASDDQTAGFWQRRIPQETIVHRWDAQAAAGSLQPIDPAAAAEGIDEFTQVGLQHSSSRPDREYPSESLHLHCSDIEGEWMLVGDGNTVTVTREHGKGDAAVRGPAASLLLWIWGRPADDLQIFGDESVASAWQSLAP